MVDSVEIETQKPLVVSADWPSGRGVVDSVEIETLEKLEVGCMSMDVEEVWWTLSRLKHVIKAFSEEINEGGRGVVDSVEIETNRENRTMRD